MIINLVVAGLAGVALPIFLEKMKIDPAIASGVFRHYDHRCSWAFLLF